MPGGKAGGHTFGRAGDREFHGEPWCDPDRTAESDVLPVGRRGRPPHADAQSASPIFRESLHTSGKRCLFTVSTSANARATPRTSASKWLYGGSSHWLRKLACGLFPAGRICVICRRSRISGHIATTWRPSLPSATPPPRGRGFCS